MKNLALLSLLAVLTIAAIGCGSKTDEANSNPVKPDTTAAQAPAPAPDAATGTTAPPDATTNGVRDVAPSTPGER